MIAIVASREEIPAPTPNEDEMHPRSECPTGGWITHGDGHRTPCPYCLPESSEREPETPKVVEEQPEVEQEAEPEPAIEESTEPDSETLIDGVPPKSIPVGTSESAAAAGTTGRPRGSMVVYSMDGCVPCELLINACKDELSKDWDFSVSKDSADRPDEVKSFPTVQIELLGKKRFLPPGYGGAKIAGETPEEHAKRSKAEFYKKLADAVREIINELKG
ncbi:hypothetical protein [Rosistilla oblonga]|uniref:hypothetical protein n=1 Tax=Rosistilla oblonga TaxID=2527990 RepID=UPI003A973A20